MPHVVTQWEAGQWSREGIESRRTRANSEYLRPITFSPTDRYSGGLRTRASLNFPGTPDSNRWDFGSIRHIKQGSTDMITPVSAVDSIFELPCNQSHESPNSSTHSSFMAELEDTSPVAVRHSSRLASPTSSVSMALPPYTPLPEGLYLQNQSMEFRCDGNTPRAVIKVVDETIAAIEETNRKLLHRAIAAEDTAKLLREQNSQLQLRIKHYSQTRPKTAPSQPAPSPRFQHRHRDSTRDPTPLSSFNSNIDKLVLDKPKRKPRPPPPYPPTRNVPYTSAQPLSPPSHVDLAPNPFTNTGFGQSSPRRPPPLSLRQVHSRSNIQEISGPIPGSVMRHEVTFDGTPISFSARAKNISLDEARRRAKPLPPLGPMSPSVVRGVVELETPYVVDEFGVDSKDVECKRRRGFSGLFKREKRKDSI
ncbi:hypothetical protein V8E51_012603 [Hyaloscypha variabilis]